MYKELIKRLRDVAEWAEGNEWDVPLMLHADLFAAAYAIEKLTAERDSVKKQHDGVAEAFRLLTEKFETVSADRDELEIALHNRLEIDGIACDYCDLVDDCPQQDDEPDYCEHWKWCRNLREDDNE